jgi:hypothetical protein
MMGLGFVSLFAAFWTAVSHDVHLNRSPLLLLSVLLELVGVQSIAIGLLSELLTRTYFESQGKPAYTVRGTLNLDRREDKRKAA